MPTASNATVTVSATDSAGTIVSAVLAVGIAAAGDPTAVTLAAIAAVEARSMELRAQNASPDAFAQAIAAFMASRPEYVASGVDADTQSAWGRFGDGSGHIVSINRTPGSAGASVAPAQLRPKLDGAALPQAFTARLLQSFGAGYDVSASATSDMASYFKSKDWNVYSGNRADIGSLMAVNGDGFFYINTHGATRGVKDHVRTGRQDLRDPDRRR